MSDPHPQACTENGLDIVMVFSGHDKAMDDDKNLSHPKRSALDIFLIPNYPNVSDGGGVLVLALKW